MANKPSIYGASDKPTKSKGEPKAISKNPPPSKTGAKGTGNIDAAKRLLLGGKMDV